MIESPRRCHDLGRSWSAAWPGLVALALVMGTAACGGSSTGSETPELDPYTPERLYPLGAGNAWSYDVDTGTGESVLAVTRVLRVTGNRYEVTSGGEPVYYEVRDQGIWKSADGAWLLKAPIEVGAEWSSGPQRTSTVREVGRKADTAAGHFDQCVEVEERSRTGRQTLTVYCSGVGPVTVVSQMALEHAGREVSVSAELRGYAVEGHDPTAASE